MKLLPYIFSILFVAQPLLLNALERDNNHEPEGILHSAGTVLYSIGSVSIGSLLGLLGLRTFASSISDLGASYAFLAKDKVSYEAHLQKINNNLSKNEIAFWSGLHVLGKTPYEFIPFCAKLAISCGLGILALRWLKAGYHALTKGKIKRKKMMSFNHYS